MPAVIVRRGPYWWGKRISDVWALYDDVPVGRPDQRLDLIFCIDTTGSMGDDIAAVRSLLVQITNEIADSISDFRIAIVDYRDFRWTLMCGSGDYAYHDVLDFTTDESAATAGSASPLSLGYGGDTRESVYSARRALY